RSMELPEATGAMLAPGSRGGDQVRTKTFAAVATLLVACGGSHDAFNDAADPVVAADGEADSVSNDLLSQVEVFFNAEQFCDKDCIGRDKLPGSKSRARFDHLVRAFGTESVTAASDTIGGQQFFQLSGCDETTCQSSVYNAKDKRVATATLNN